MPGQQTHGAGAEILRGSCCRHRAGVEVGHPGPAGSREQPCSSPAIAFQEHQVFQASERGLQAPPPAGHKRPPVTPQHPHSSNWRALTLGAAWQRPCSPAPGPAQVAAHARPSCPLAAILSLCLELRLFGSQRRCLPHCPHQTQGWGSRPRPGAPR